MARYGSYGAEIKCYSIYHEDFDKDPFVTVVKKQGIAFNIPDCTLPCQNGIPLPANVDVPVSLTGLEHPLISDWEKLKKAFVSVMNGDTSAIKRASG
jgi:hypothetical protein